MDVETIYLPSALARRLRALAESEAVSLEDYLLEIALSNTDPPGRARAYAEVALDLLRAAEEELRAGDLRQASEKIWGAAALAVKAYAYWRDGVRLASHGELWRYAKKIADELGNWVHDAWNAANAMHINFYEGWATAEQVAEALKRVEKLVKEIVERVQTR
ncbi:PaREP1 family protein [Pyrobaculum ferrireducens]|uniref:Transcriptional regulator, Fis family n=1 Tax=Pyrobaculum ferrireducens TaxID=1104324 RepID=G7VHF0_9CREN|nr:transcriptional regulator, Fis family [Pyrobaculum ferrireducens]